MRLKPVASPFREMVWVTSRIVRRISRLRLFYGLILGLFSGGAPMPLVAVAGIEASETRFTPAHVYANTTAVIINIVENESYRSLAMDNALSAQILERYLNSLDPDRNIFLHEDITAFARYKERLDEAMHAGDLDPIFAIFAVFQARLEQRTDFAQVLLQGPVELDTNETYSLEGNNRPWAASQLELDELWRKRVKNDLISLRLAGQESARAATTLRTRYQQLKKYAANLQPDEVYQIFINAYLSLLDPHSAYFLPRTLKRNHNPAKPPLEGIGVQLKRDKDFAVVKRIFAGGSADRSGQIHPGDRIIGVANAADGEITDVVAWTLKDIVSLIRGPKGTVVRLWILPKDAPLHRPHRLVTLTRDRIKLEELRTKKSIIPLSKGDLGHRIGVIHIPKFYLDYAGYGRGTGNYLSTTRDVERLINELKRQNIDGLLIDLRGNRGGALLEAVRLTGLFIASGPVVQVKDAVQHVEIYRDSDLREIYSGPLAVLVDRYSASASEIFAGAIQDYRRGLVIGEHTYGKGTVQQTIDINRSSNNANVSFGQLVITIAQYFRVTGNSTQIRGVVPDIVFPTRPSLHVAGESTEPNALPWERISSLEFKPFANAPMVNPEIRERHLTRLHQGIPLRETLGTAQPEGAAQLKNNLSLNLNNRRRKQEAEQQALRTRENRWRRALGLHPLLETQPDDGQLQKRWADQVLMESAEILSDAIEQNRRSELSSASPRAKLD